MIPGRFKSSILIGQKKNILKKQKIKEPGEEE